jgi:hypothetical protein
VDEQTNGLIKAGESIEAFFSLWLLLKCLDIYFLTLFPFDSEGIIWNYSSNFINFREKGSSYQTKWLRVIT